MKATKKPIVYQEVFPESVSNSSGLLIFCWRSYCKSGEMVGNDQYVFDVQALGMQIIHANKLQRVVVFVVVLIVLIFTMGAALCG